MKGEKGIPINTKVDFSCAVGVHVFRFAPPLFYNVTVDILVMNTIAIASRWDIHRMARFT
jgi:hypothetical protein